MLLKNSSVKLDWYTAAETNNNFFTIERSENGLDWKEITKINGAGSSSTHLNYNWIDKTPYLGISYYRLKQVDFDGQFSYSKTRCINLKSYEESEIKTFPNPTENITYIAGKNLQSKQVNIYNAIGQDVTSFTKKNSVSASKILIDLSGLNKGVYFIKTQSTTKKIYKK